MAVPGELGFIIKLCLLSGPREEELVYVYKNRASLQTVQKLNDALMIVILNRFEGHKKAYFTILPTPVWEQFKAFLCLAIKLTFQARTR